MSMYELAVADGRQNERGAILIPMLGIPGVGRFRDAWVEKDPEDGLVIAIYTRTGGPNRACECGYPQDHTPELCWKAANEVLTGNEYYLRDADDTFDATYAVFRFRVPAEYQPFLEQDAVDPVDTSRRWRDAIARVERGEIRPAETAFMDQLAATLGDPSADGPRIMEI